MRYGCVSAAKKNTVEKIHIRSHARRQVLTARRLIHILLKENTVVDEFWASLASHFFCTFLPQGMGLHYDDVDGDRFEHYYKPALRNFYGLIHKLLMSTIRNSPSLLINESQ